MTSFKRVELGGGQSGIHDENFRIKCLGTWPRRRKGWKSSDSLSGRSKYGTSCRAHMDLIDGNAFTWRVASEK